MCMHLPLFSEIFLLCSRMSEAKDQNCEEASIEYPLNYCCTVWHTSCTAKERSDLQWWWGGGWQRQLLWLYCPLPSGMSILVLAKRTWPVRYHSLKSRTTHLKNSSNNNNNQCTPTTSVHFTLFLDCFSKACYFTFVLAPDTNRWENILPMSAFNKTFCFLFYAKTDSKYNYSSVISSSFSNAVSKELKMHFSFFPPLFHRLS